jgi:hypothetical protein
MACLTAGTFCGDRTLRGLPRGFFFKAEHVALKFATHNSMVFLSETVAFRPTLKWVQTNRCVAMIDSAFFKYVSTTYARFSPLHAMTATEMVRQVLFTDTSLSRPSSLVPEQRRRQIRELFLPHSVFNCIHVCFLKTFRFWLIQEFRRYYLSYLHFHLKYYQYIQFSYNQFWWALLPFVAMRWSPLVTVCFHALGSTCYSPRHVAGVIFVGRIMLRCLWDRFTVSDSSLLRGDGFLLKLIEHTVTTKLSFHNLSPVYTWP